jgi:sulfonate transport system permease protein
MSVAIETIKNNAAHSAIPLKVIPKHNKRSLRGNGISKNIINLILQLIVPAVIISIWILITEKGWIKPYFIPKIPKIGIRFIEMIRFENLLSDFWLSFHVMLIGYALGVTLGLIQGFILGISRISDTMFSPVLNAIRQVPLIAWFPLFVLFLGITTPMKIVFITVGVFIHVYLNVYQGIRAVNNEYIEVARVFEYTQWQTVRKVIFPAAFPAIYTGLRLAAGFSWGYVVFAEMMNGRRGMGWVLQDAQELLDAPRLYVTIVIIGFFGFAIDFLLGLLEKRVMRWKRQTI